MASEDGAVPVDGHTTGPTGSETEEFYAYQRSNPGLDKAAYLDWYTKRFNKEIELRRRRSDQPSDLEYMVIKKRSKYRERIGDEGVELSAYAEANPGKSYRQLAEWYRDRFGKEIDITAISRVLKRNRTEFDSGTPNPEQVPLPAQKRARRSLGSAGPIQGPAGEGAPPNGHHQLRVHSLPQIHQHPPPPQVGPRHHSTSHTPSLTPRHSPKNRAASLAGADDFPPRSSPGVSQFPPIQPHPVGHHYPPLRPLPHPQHPSSPDHHPRSMWSSLTAPGQSNAAQYPRGSIAVSPHQRPVPLPDIRPSPLTAPQEHQGQVQPQPGQSSVSAAQPPPTQHRSSYSHPPPGPLQTLNQPVAQNGINGAANPNAGQNGANGANSANGAVTFNQPVGQNGLNGAAPSGPPSRHESFTGGLPQLGPPLQQVPPGQGPPEIPGFQAIRRIVDEVRFLEMSLTNMTNDRAAAERHWVEERNGLLRERDDLRVEIARFRTWVEDLQRGNIELQEYRDKYERMRIDFQREEQENVYVQGSVEKLEAQLKERNAQLEVARKTLKDHGIEDNAGKNPTPPGDAESGTPPKEGPKQWVSALITGGAQHEEKLMVLINEVEQAPINHFSTKLADIREYIGTMARERARNAEQWEQASKAAEAARNKDEEPPHVSPCASPLPGSNPGTTANSPPTATPAATTPTTANPPQQEESSS